METSRLTSFGAWLMQTSIPFPCARRRPERLASRCTLYFCRRNARPIHCRLGDPRLFGIGHDNPKFVTNLSREHLVGAWIDAFRPRPVRCWRRDAFSIFTGRIESSPVSVSVCIWILDRYLANDRGVARQPILLEELRDKVIVISVVVGVVRLSQVFPIMLCHSQRQYYYKPRSSSTVVAVFPIREQTERA